MRAQVADHRSDIFSFGVILHEMIMGRRAFQHDTTAETMAAILKEEPAELSQSQPHISPSLERIVRRCLEKRPEQRFQSTADLGFALEALASPATGSGGGLTTAAATAVAATTPPAWRARSTRRKSRRSSPTTRRLYTWRRAGWSSSAIKSLSRRPSTQAVFRSAAMQFLLPRESRLATVFLFPRMA